MCDGPYGAIFPGGHGSPFRTGFGVHRPGDTELAEKPNNDLPLHALWRNSSDAHTGHYPDVIGNLNVENKALLGFVW